MLHCNDVGNGQVIAELGLEPRKVVERLSDGKLSQGLWDLWTKAGSLWVVCLLHVEDETYRAAVQVLNAPQGAHHEEQRRPA